MVAYIKQNLVCNNKKEGHLKDGVKISKNRLESRGKTQKRMKVSGENHTVSQGTSSWRGVFIALRDTT